MQKNDSKSKLEKRIEELQSDIKFSFKQTSEVIDIIYRTAVNDCKSGIDDTKEVVDTAERKRFGSKTTSPDEDTKDVSLEKAQTQINKLKATIGSLKKELEQYKKSNKKNEEVPADNTYRGGMLAALKWCLEILDDHDRIESYEIIRNKYNVMYKK